MKFIREQLEDCKRECLAYKTPFFMLLAIYLLAFSAVFRANFGFVDDIGRTYAGYHGWLDWSRWTTEILATFVHAGWRLTDISPLPQVLACIFMAAGGIILLVIFKEEKKINFWNIIAVSLTALAPYFLGIISYKFDSPYMALSFLASVIPFLFRKKKAWVYAVVSVICLLIMCTTYQASSGVYPMVVVFVILQKMMLGEKLKDQLKFLFLSAMCYLLSLGIFWLFLMRENGVSVFSFADMLPSAWNRYRSYYSMIYEDFTAIWLILIAAVAVLFIAVVGKTSKTGRLFGLLLGGVTALIGSFLCFGAYLFISEEAYDTRAMYGFNVFLTLMAVFISFEVRHWIPKIVYTLLAWSFLVFSLTYGNALAQQQNYTDYRVQLLAADLNDLEIMNTGGQKEVRIEGDIGPCPVVAGMAEVYPLLSRITFTGLSEGYWGGYYLYHYFNIPDITGITDGSRAEDLPVLKDTMYHTIRGNESSIVISLK